MTAERVELSDADLANRARGGDEQAFALLFGRHETRILAIGRRWFGDGWLSCEVVEETRWLAWRHLPGLREPAAVGAWLASLARHHCRQRCRAGQPEVLSLTVELTAVLPAEDDPAGQAAAALDTERLLACLPPEQREVVELCLLAGYSREEAAVRLSVGETVGKGRLQRARATLRREWTP